MLRHPKHCDANPTELGGIKNVRTKGSAFHTLLLTAAEPQ
jgi:hypothetical protein